MRSVRRGCAVLLASCVAAAAAATTTTTWGSLLSSQQWCRVAVRCHARGARVHAKLSPHDALQRAVNELVRRRDAHGAVAAVRAGLAGRAPCTPCAQEQEQQRQQHDTTRSADDATAQHDAVQSWQPVGECVFAWSALSAALYACEVSGCTALGLALVDDVRRVLGDAQWRDEKVLTGVLRLQCAAGDVAAAAHIFDYLVQQRQLRRRSAAAFVQLCCAHHRVEAAFAAYAACARAGVELGLDEYVALGRLCVRAAAPLSVLHDMLVAMSESVPVVSEAMVRDVLVPWCNTTLCSDGDDKQHKDSSSSSSSSSMCVTPCTVVTTTTTSARAGGGDGSEQPHSPAAALLSSCGVCSHCGHVLRGYAFTRAHKAQLLRDLSDSVLPRLARHARARHGFACWQRYVHERCARGDRVDVIIDGANVGYYGLSRWYAHAKQQQQQQQQHDVGGTTTAAASKSDADDALSLAARRKSGQRGVDVAVDYALIDEAVRVAMEEYGMRRPLILLHERHCEAHLQQQKQQQQQHERCHHHNSNEDDKKTMAAADDERSRAATALVTRWRDAGWLYCTPTGLDDDVCWLYAALYMTPTTDDSNDNDKQQWQQQSLSLHTREVLVLTNDCMRDHHFRLLSPRCFARWRTRHRVTFACERVDGAPRLRWRLPPLYDVCIQATQTAAGVRGWHVPYTCGDKCGDDKDKGDTADDDDNAASGSDDDEAARDDADGAMTTPEVQWDKMTKGTTSMGQRHGRTHILCRRCGRNAYHVQWKRCAACAYPRASRRRYNWSVKAIKRRTTGTGRCRYLKVVHRRIANHFKTPKA